MRSPSWARVFRPALFPLPLVPPAANLQDIANRAGVHRSTVALALRDSPRISSATRKRVQKIARELGYRPNPLVTALMTARRSGKPVKHVTLAYVTNYPTRFGWRPEYHDRPDYFPGAEQRALDFGYKVEHFWLREPGMTPVRFSDILAARGIHGVMIGRLPPGEHTLELAWARFSAVAVGLTLHTPLLHQVAENHFEAAAQALRQCTARGYRRIGLVYSEADDSPRVGHRWLSAFAGYQMELPAEWRVPLCPGVPASEAEFVRWFREHRPEALLVTHARPVLAWLGRMKLVVPCDVGLVDLAGDHPELACAGVHCAAARIGALAVETLVGMLHRGEQGVRTMCQESLLSGEWREGSSLPPRTPALAAPAGA